MSYRILEDDPNTAAIVLSNGGETFVDAADAPALDKFNWHWVEGKTKHSTRIYIRRHERLGHRQYRKVYMHRQITGAGPDMDVDHKDHDGRNNRRSNFRVTDHVNNTRNRQKTTGGSRFKGVCWHKKAGKWCSGIKINYKRTHLGLFDNELEAAEAYDVAAIKAFGEFAHLNFPVDRSKEQD